MGRFDAIAGNDRDTRPAPASEETWGYEHFYKEAVAALERGRYEGALRLFGRALERERDQAPAWEGQLRCLLAMGHPSEVLTWVEQAERVAGERPTFHALRAVACARLGQLDDALAWSDRAMRRGEDDAQVWLSRAEVVYSHGRRPVAVAALQKAAERDPSPRVRLRAGEIAVLYGDLGTAEVWLTQALRQLPEDPLVALQLGLLRERQGDPARAQAELERALALEPRMPAAELALQSIRERSPWQGLLSAFRRWRHGA